MRRQSSLLTRWFAKAMGESGNDKVSSAHCLRWKSLSPLAEEGNSCFVLLALFSDLVRREEEEEARGRETNFPLPSPSRLQFSLAR